LTEVQRDLDLFIPNDFAQALKERISRPFIFGPIEFTGLDQDPLPWNLPEVWGKVIQQLEMTPYLPENLCLHGFTVTAKGRRLKRRSTIVHHSRFLRNMQVSPIFPPEPEVVEVVEDEEKNEEDEDQD
jgi:hypothetical protein